MDQGSKSLPRNHQAIWGKYTMCSTRSRRWYGYLRKVFKKIGSQSQNKEMELHQTKKLLCSNGDYQQSEEVITSWSWKSPDVLTHSSSPGGCGIHRYRWWSWRINLEFTFPAVPRIPWGLQFPALDLSELKHLAYGFFSEWSPAWYWRLGRQIGVTSFGHKMSPGN